MQEITLSSIEHFLFCPYQWWLIYSENEWADNSHTIQGNILHSKVDDKNFVEKRGALIIRRSVPLYSDVLDLYGIADLMEFCEGGGKKIINVVEYKNGSPDDNGQIRIHDGMQLYAQMLCAKEIFGCQVNGYIFYGKQKRRFKLKNLDFYHEKLLQTLSQMRVHTGGDAPPKNIGKHCKACSLYETCLPFCGGENEKTS